MGRSMDRIVTAAVAAAVTAALAAAPALAADDESPVPTPSPSALATVDPSPTTPGPPAGTATPATGPADVWSLGGLTDQFVAPLVVRLRLTAALVLTAPPSKPGAPGAPGPGQGQPVSPANLQPGGGSATDGREWRPRADLQVPKAAPAPPRGAKRPAALTKEQVIWAAYAAAAKAQPDCHISPTLLAAIGEVESSSLRGRTLSRGNNATPPVRGPALAGGNFASIRDSDDGRFDGDPVWDRAVGPMQFIPGTWRLWGADGNGDGVKNPQNIEDAALAAARYLCAGGRDLSRPADLRAAVLSYNHSRHYLNTVLALAEAVASGAEAGP